MSKQNREVLADWMIVVGGLMLFASLFLTWSHQFSRPFLTEFGTTDLLHGVPHDPTAWQVYSSMDVVLALVAVGLVSISMLGARRDRIVAAGASAVALIFTFNALSNPPTSGANIFNPAYSVPHYASPGATAGAGETLAILALLIALGGLALSFSAD